MTVVCIVSGFILTITVGAFLAMVFTSEMENNLGRLVLGVLIAFAIGFGIVGLIKLEYDFDAKRWNNGICSTCGKSLELFDVEHHRTGDTYYYKCENGHLLKAMNHFEK